MITTITGADILGVTQEQIDRCFRFIDSDGRVAYAVKSESDPDVEYTVRFTPGRGFSCTCPAGQDGFLYCHKGTCKHCRWAYAHAEQYRQEQAAIARNEHIARLMGMGLTRDEAASAVDAKLTINGTPADDATLVRVFAAKNAPTEQEVNAMAEAYQPKAFAILR
jgi:hypothetical protein